MTRTPIRSVVVLLVAALALGIALVSTAAVGNAAATITKAQVKKIAKRVATKVVKNAAPTLSVAHAQTATNAQNALTLDNKPASAYLDDTTVYTATIPSANPVTMISFPIPVGPGSSFISYSLWMGGAALEGGCDIEIYAGNVYTSFTGTDYGFVGQSGSAVVTPTAGQSVRLTCFSLDGNTFYTGANNPLQVSVTPLDTVTNGGSLTALPRGTAGRPGARGE